MKKQTWQQWVRACAKDPKSPSGFAGYKNPLATLTGQDTRALDAIVACYGLYAVADGDGRRRSIIALRTLICAMQEKNWWIALELIPFVLDWSDRGALWREIGVPTNYTEEYGDPGNNSFSGPDQ